MQRIVYTRTGNSKKKPVLVVSYNWLAYGT